MKMALFSLKTLIREEAFVKEFVDRRGADELAAICRTAPLGNTLAYALASLQSLTELESGWDNLTADDVSRLVKLVSSPATQINVLRPATAILRKLVLSGPESRPASLPDDDTVHRYGFEPVWASINATCPAPSAFLSVLATRISSGSASSDFHLTQASLSLVNALAKSSLSSSPSQLLAFDAAMADAKVGDAVVSAMQDQRATDGLGPLALGFQTHVDASAHRLVSTPVVAEDVDAVSTLIAIADRAKSLDAKVRGAKRAEREGEDLELRKWKTVGFEAENLLEDFAGSGMLGLVLMKRFVDRHSAEFDKVGRSLEQLTGS